MSGISEKDYQHTCKVWNEFGLKNIRLSRLVLGTRCDTISQRIRVV